MFYARGTIHKSTIVAEQVQTRECSVMNLVSVETFICLCQQASSDEEVASRTQLALYENEYSTCVAPELVRGGCCNLGRRLFQSQPNEYCVGSKRAYLRE